MKRISAIFLACLLILPVAVLAGAEESPTRDIPTAPENVQTEPRDGATRITWDFPAGMTGDDLIAFTVYKGTSSDNVNTVIANLGPYDQSHVDSPLTNGKTYYYSVVAISSEGTGPKSNPVSAIPRGPASAPTNVQTGYGANMINISWEEPNDNNGAPVTEYVVFKGLTDDNITIRNDVGNVFEYEDMGLINGKTYFYQLAAINDYGDGDKTNIFTIVPRTSPSPPTNFSAKGSDGEVHLKWNSSLDNGGAFIQGYSIFRGLAIESMEKIATVDDQTQRTYADTTVTNGITYLYSIAAFNTEGDGEFAPAVSATPMGPPSKPINMELTAGDAQVHITWETPENDGGSEILGYRIYKNKHNEEMKLDSEIGSELEYTVNDLENNQIYYFQVRAFNVVGEGRGSNTTMIRPEPIPKTPLNFRVIDMEEQVKLVWTKPSYTGEYPYESVLIYRGETDDSLELHANISADISQYFDEDVEVGTVYYYEVSIISSIGEGYRTPMMIGRPYDRPSIPRNLEITTESGKAFLTWDQPEFTGGRVIESFNVFRGTDLDTMTVLVNVGGMQTYFNDTTLTDGVQYYYMVSAINMELEGNTTAIIEAMPVGPPGNPTSGSAVFDPANETVQISWVHPQANGGSEITHFRVYRGPERDNLTFIMEISVDEDFHDDSIKNGEGYYYAIAAVNDEGEGDISPVFFVQIPVDEGSDSDDGSGILLWIIIIIVVVVVIVFIIILALVSSKKKKKEEEEKEEVPHLAESESEREERLIRERREQMGEFTSISTTTTEAHSHDHDEHSLSYDDLYGSNSIYEHHEEEQTPSQPVEQQIGQGEVPAEPGQQSPAAEPQQQPQVQEGLQQPPQQ